MSETTALTRASTSGESYLTRSSTSGTSYLTKTSTETINDVSTSANWYLSLVYTNTSGANTIVTYFGMGFSFTSTSAAPGGYLGYIMNISRSRNTLSETIYWTVSTKSNNRTSTTSRLSNDYSTSSQLMTIGQVYKNMQSPYPSVYTATGCHSAYNTGTSYYTLSSTTMVCTTTFHEQYSSIHKQTTSSYTYVSNNKSYGYFTYYILSQKNTYISPNYSSEARTWLRSSDPAVTFYSFTANYYTQSYTYTSLTSLTNTTSSKTSSNTYARQEDTHGIYVNSFRNNSYTYSARYRDGMECTSTFSNNQNSLEIKETISFYSHYSDSRYSRTTYSRISMFTITTITSSSIASTSTITKTSTTATSYLTRSSTSATQYLTRSSTSGYSGKSSSSSSIETSSWV